MIKVEDHYWQKDSLFEEQAFKFVIQLRESDDSTDTGSDSSSDDSD